MAIVFRLIAALKTVFRGTKKEEHVCISEKETFSMLRECKESSLCDLDMVT